jgi:hypothetical protein
MVSALIMSRGDALSEDDQQRLKVAYGRIHDALEVSR